MPEQQHPPADAEEDDAEHHRQPEQLREEDVRKLLYLGHLALGSAPLTDQRA
jgi:hypothetical protein